jgi:1-acyl-sn-glycerol-3-phosphate acyltransferase
MQESERHGDATEAEGALRALARSVAADARSVAGRYLVPGVLATSALAALVLRRILPERHTFLPDHGSLWSFAKLQSRALVRLCGATVTVRGRERLAGGGPFVFVANHQSYFDFIALVAVLPGATRLTVTAELAGHPFWGPLCRALGMIMLAEDTGQEAVADGLQTTAEAEASVIIFPEGRRGPGGRLLPFADLPFVAAIAVGGPVVPVAIRGTRTIMSALGSRESDPVDVEVILHEPVPTEHLIAEDFHPLREDVRNAIARYVDEIDMSADAPSPAAAEPGRVRGAVAGGGVLRVAEPSSA